MAQEKEIKIQLKIPIRTFVKRIRTRGFKLVKSIEQTDIYFDTADWFLYNHIAALRLRLTEGKDGSFSFKKVFYLPKKKDKFYIEEIETHAPFNQTEELLKIFSRVEIPYPGTVFNSGKELTAFLRQNRYFNEQIMPKTRTVYSDGKNEIVIDDIDRVGIIFELECTKEEPLDVIKKLLKSSEWSRSLEGSSYIWLKNVKGLTSHIANLERFKTEPDWNVWKNEREMYKKLLTELESIKETTEILSITGVDNSIQTGVNQVKGGKGILLSKLE